MRVAAWAAMARHRRSSRVLTGGDIPTPTATEAAAIVYLAVITTALAFVLWFGAVQQLGADRAGLLVGLMPIAAVTVDTVLNGHAPSTADSRGRRSSPRGGLGAGPRGLDYARGGTRAASPASGRDTASPPLFGSTTWSGERWTPVR